MLLIPLPADRPFQVGSTDQRRRRALSLPINGTVVLICAFRLLSALSPRTQSIPISHSSVAIGPGLIDFHSFVFSLSLSPFPPHSNGDNYGVCSAPAHHINATGLYHGSVRDTARFTGETGTARPEIGSCSVGADHRLSRADRSDPSEKDS